MPELIDVPLEEVEIETEYLVIFPLIDEIHQSYLAEFIEGNYGEFLFEVKSLKPSSRFGTLFLSWFLNTKPIIKSSLFISCLVLSFSFFSISNLKKLSVFIEPFKVFTCENPFLCISLSAKEAHV